MLFSDWKKDARLSEREVSEPYFDYVTRAFNILKIMVNHASQAKILVILNSKNS